LRGQDEALERPLPVSQLCRGEPHSESLGAGRRAERPLQTRLGPRSRYALRPPSAGRGFGRGLERLRSIFVTVPDERGETGRDDGVAIASNLERKRYSYQSEPGARRIRSQPLDCRSTRRASSAASAAGSLLIDNRFSHGKRHVRNVGEKSNAPLPFWPRA
jgi:hypothetical protein